MGVQDFLPSPPLESEELEPPPEGFPPRPCVLRRTDLFVSSFLESTDCFFALNLSGYNLATPSCAFSNNLGINLGSDGAANNFNSFARASYRILSGSLSTLYSG